MFRRLGVGRDLYIRGGIIAVIITSYHDRHPILIIIWISMMVKCRALNVIVGVADVLAAR